MSHANVSRRLTLLLALTFTLTMISFIVATNLSDYQARGTHEAAREIGEVALPANEALSMIRTELMHADRLLDELVEPQAPDHDGTRLRGDLETTRQAIRRNWAAYSELPLFPGERALIDAAAPSHAALDTSIDTVIAKMRVGDRLGSVAEVNARTRPAITAVDAEVRASAALNRSMAVDAAEKIARFRSRSRTWGFASDGISAALALLAAYFVIRVVRRLWTMSEERLSELEMFSARVAHDIRSPLSAVSLSLDLAKRRPGLDTKTLTLLDRGTKSLERVGALVDGLLVFARAGVPPVAVSGVNTRDVLSGIIEDLRPLADEKDIAIVCEFPYETPVVACHPGVLVSLTSNLLTNAIKYMGDSPVRRIALRVRPSSGTIRIEVADTGPGIAPAVQDRIFDPHVRGADASVPGLGLGLATVRRLAEAHGGSVGVNSNSGDGSLFWFELPQWKGSTRTPQDSSTS